jgi:hypothetical protein
MSGNGTGGNVLNFTSGGSSPPYSLLGVAEPTDLSNSFSIWGAAGGAPVNGIFFYSAGAAMLAGPSGGNVIAVATSGGALNAIVAVEQTANALLYTNFGNNSGAFSNASLQNTQSIDNASFPMKGYICEIADYHSDQSSNQAALISNMTTRW